MIQAIANFFKFISGIYLFYLFYLFIKWYIGGHFKKYFIFFWLNTILSIYMYYDNKHKREASYNPKSGQEIWTENMKNYDPVRGY